MPLLARLREQIECVDAKSGDSKLNPSWDDFKKAVCKGDSAVWGVIDFEAKKADGSVLNKMIFVSWCPDNIGVRMKMMHGSSTETIKRKFQLNKSIQASTPAEVELKEAKALVGLKD